MSGESNNKQLNIFESREHKYHYDPHSSVERHSVATPIDSDLKKPNFEYPVPNYSQQKSSVHRDRDEQSVGSEGIQTAAITQGNHS